MLPTITIDIGTTSVKLSLFDGNGDVVASAKHATPTVRDRWGEIYNTDLLERHIFEFISSLDAGLRRTVQRVAITGVGESGGLVTADGALASPMILWHDHRGADRLRNLSNADRAAVYAIAGIPVNANYGISKTAWAIDQLPTATPDAQWLNVAEWIAARMTGTRWSEFSLASRTMALDLQRRDWSGELCDLFGVSVHRFPELRSAREGAPITQHIARALDLDVNVIVHVAGHDHMVGAIGADLHPGELLNSTGTTEGLLFLADQPVLTAAARDAKLANGVSCTGEHYTLFASIPTGGSAFATLQTMLHMSADDIVTALSSLTGRYLDGQIDLEQIPLVLPQFRGSPPPTKNAAARGVIAGLQTDTTAEDIIFGCFLGMALQFRDVLDLFPIDAAEVKVIGPASSNPLWQHLKADLLGTSLSASQFPEVVSRGAQALSSHAPSAWTATDPHQVTVDDQRHREISAWAASVRPRWEHLKATPE
jgi:sugar (pentulose or hexulose) kinase